MKGKLSLLGVAVLTLAFGLTACGGSTSPSASPSPSAAPTATKTITVTEAQVPAIVTMKVGDKLKVLLESNESTGYVWNVVSLGDQAILTQVGKAKYIPGESNLVGAPGQTQFTFQAIAEGTQQLGFYYARPSDKANPDSAAAVLVKVAKGRMPVEVTAGDEYTAETATIRDGDTLQVVIKHASAKGKTAWKVQSSTAPVKVSGSAKYSSANGGTVTMNFVSTGTGTGTLVLVNKPSGEPPLETYALPVYVKAVQQPITIAVNQNDAGQTVSTRVDDTIQLSLPSQPSTGYQWELQLPNILKQVGEPTFVADNQALGAKGKTIWKLKVAATGTKAVNAALLGPNAGSTGPAQTFTFTVAAKPGFNPKVVQAVDSYPSQTLFVKPGDTIKLSLDAQAGTWKPKGGQNQLTYSKVKVDGKIATITYTAKNPGNTTQLLVAEASGAWPNQAYAFSAVIGKGTAPTTVTAVKRDVAKTVQLAVDDTLAIELPGSSGTGYSWSAAPLSPPGVLEQVGDITYATSTDLVGGPGVFTAMFKAVGAGLVPLVFTYTGPQEGAAPEAVWGALVQVK